MMSNPFNHHEFQTIGEVFSHFGMTTKQEKSAWDTIIRRWHETSGRFYAYTIANEIGAKVMREASIAASVPD